MPINSAKNAIPVIALGEVDSTQEQAKLLLSQGKSAPFLVLAESQIQGRGRLGRSWASPKGNLYCTMAMPCRAEPLAAVSYAVSLGLYDSLVQCGIDPAIMALKWPNDVLLDEKKIAGILIENISQDIQGALLLIGVGVNLRLMPTEARWPPAKLDDYVANIPSPEFLAQDLAGRINEYVKTLKNHGFGPLRGLWLRRAYRLGQEIGVSGDEQEPQKRGVFLDIASDGALLLQQADGVAAIYAGDFLR